MRLPQLPVSILGGAYKGIVDEGLIDEFEEWRTTIELRAESDGDWYLRALLNDDDLAAVEFKRAAERRLMALPRKTSKKDRGKKPKRRRGGEATVIDLPTEARIPEMNPWRYAYLITGEKKIGKTSWAIEGCKELVLQFDKPQLAYKIVEMCPASWDEIKRIVKELKRRAADGTFPYERIVIDGVNEMYAMCLAAVCKPLGVNDPGEMDDFGKTWRRVKAEFKDLVNDLLRLQTTANCGLVFIAHAEWKTRKKRGGGEVERLEADLSNQADDIVGGKVDGWFIYIYDGEDRMLIVRGDEETSGGHRIDGHFITPDGRQVREIPMGSTVKEANEAFIRAFNNEQPWADMAEWRKDKDGRTAKKRSGKVAKKARKKTHHR